MFSQAPAARVRLLSNKKITGEIISTLMAYFQVLEDPNMLECMLKLATHRQTEIAEDRENVSPFSEELKFVMDMEALTTQKSEKPAKKSKRPCFEKAQCVNVVLGVIDTCLALR